MSDMEPKSSKFYNSLWHASICYGNSKKSDAFITFSTIHRYVTKKLQRFLWCTGAMLTFFQKIPEVLLLILFVLQAPDKELNNLEISNIYRRSTDFFLGNSKNSETGITCLTYSTINSVLYQSLVLQFIFITERDIFWENVSTLLSIRAFVLLNC